jgi:hypothetical protein
VLDLKNHPGAEKGDTQLLRVCLYYLTFSEGFVEWVDKKTRAGNDTSESTQLEVDFLFDEDPTPDAQQKEYKGLTEASLISLLRLTGVEEEPVEKPIRQTDDDSASKSDKDIKKMFAAHSDISELTVERAVGSALSGIFYSATKVYIIRRALHSILFHFLQNVSVI